AAVVLAGNAGGRSAVRALGGESPLTTLNVTHATTQTRVHIDRLGFSVLVPTGWIEYRLEPPEGAPTVTFISPDRTEELVVSSAPNLEAARTDAGSGDAVLTDVEDDPAAKELVYSTSARTSWRRIVPGAGSPAPSVYWTVTLSVPEAAAGAASERLHDRLADGFVAPAQ
ncbi:MAG: hypothetical protein L0H84_17605, partial [Pseudonocardia sp.]|nr:hypothetical protein [Pseudonocardia sp.]